MPRSPSEDKKAVALHTIQQLQQYAQCRRKRQRDSQVIKGYTLPLPDKHM